MAKITQFPSAEPQVLLYRMVADHGDAFRFSLSKRGRIWLTLTHWDQEKYNTSVELDSMTGAEDYNDALTVLVVAHYAKCFRGGPHADTWMGVDAARNLLGECRGQLSDYLLAQGDPEASPPPTTVETSSGSNMETSS